MRKKVKTFVKEKVNYYLEVPYVYKEQIQQMFDVRWDRDRKKWFTNIEYEVQHIEEKLDQLRENARNNLSENVEFLKSQIEKFVLLMFPLANDYERIGFKNQLVENDYNIDKMYPNLRIDGTNYKLKRLVEEEKKEEKKAKKKKLQEEKDFLQANNDKKDADIIPFKIQFKDNG